MDSKVKLLQVTKESQTQINSASSLPSLPFKRQMEGLGREKPESVLKIRGEKSGFRPL